MSQTSTSPLPRNNSPIAMTVPALRLVRPDEQPTRSRDRNGSTPSAFDDSPLGAWPGRYWTSTMAADSPGVGFLGDSPLAEVVQLHGCHPGTESNPVVCRTSSDEAADLDETLGRLHESLGDSDALAHYEMAMGLHELGLYRSALTFLQSSIVVGGATVGACELMGKCLQELGHYDSAMHWYLFPIGKLDLPGESLFELVRQASSCRAMNLEQFHDRDSAPPPAIA